MRTVNCPSCGMKLAVREEVLSQKVKCGKCKATFMIAQESEQGVGESTLPSISIDTSLARPSKPRRIRTIVRGAMQLAMTCVTLYVAYYVLTQRQAVQPEATVEKREPQRRLTVPQPVPPKPRVIVPRPEKQSPAPEPPPIPAPKVPPFKNLPSSVALPATDNGNRHTLFGITTDAAIHLVCSMPDLTLEKEIVYWHSGNGNEVPVAEVKIRNKEFQFRWLGEVPQEAEIVLWNSLIKLTHDSNEHVLALREPVHLPAPTIDLTNSMQRIICRVEHSPEPKEVWFDLPDEGLFPPHRVEGKGLQRIRIGDETFLWWNGADAAATKISLVRKGNAAVLELDSRYKLPSGDEEPMSIPRGNRKLKDLNDLLSTANEAAASIGELRSYRSKLIVEARRPTGGMVNGIWVENPVLAARRADLLSEIDNTEGAIARAQNLIDNKPAIEKELRELQRVSEVAQSLHEKAKLVYRFYTIVDDQEVELVVTE